MNRSILHCDMNNFYASVECMLDPSLRKYPVAVCGSVEERHGIVLAKNYAAKAFDVKTGDAVWQAKQKCKDLVIVPPHYEEYIKYSKLARSVYSRFTDQVEPYGMGILGCNGYEKTDSIICLTANGDNNFLNEGIVEGSILFIETRSKFQEGLLNVFKYKSDNSPQYKLSRNKVAGAAFVGKVLMAVNQY